MLGPRWLVDTLALVAISGAMAAAGGAIALPVHLALARALGVGPLALTSTTDFASVVVGFALACGVIPLVALAVSLAERLVTRAAPSLPHLATYLLSTVLFVAASMAFDAWWMARSLASAPADLAPVVTLSSLSLGHVGLRNGMLFGVALAALVVARARRNAKSPPSR